MNSIQSQMAGVVETLRSPAEHLARRYAVFLVDHGRSSRSTHRFWWNHFEDACGILGVSCTRVPRGSRSWPQTYRRQGRRGVYLFFTAASLYHDRWRRVRAVRRDAILPEDIVASWDVEVVEEYATHCHALRIGFPSEKWLEAHARADRARLVFWEPFASLAAVERGLRTEPTRVTWDFAYFGTLNPHNYDQFLHILTPLAARHRCRYAGKMWRIASLAPLRYGFSPFMVSEERGLELLSRSRINLVLHNDYHRVTRTLTERLFASAALGRIVVCDHEGAWRYFSTEEVSVAEDPRTFLLCCEELLGTADARQELTREIQRKVLQRYTYLHTVVRLLTEIDRACHR